MGEAALWGGSSMAVGMAANPHEAHQADRHIVSRMSGNLPLMNKTGGRVADRHARHLSGERSRAIHDSLLHSR
jgi:hypothetical protein